MRFVFILFLSLISTLAIAADTVYLSSLTNGTPPTLNVARFGRTTLNGPLNLQSSISLTLVKAGGVTSIQPNGTTQLHVYRTEAVGSKVRIVRETVDLTTFTFVSGSTRAFPANLSAFSLNNFDSNDVRVLVQKQSGTRLHIRPVNPAGNIAGGFRPVSSFPFAPFGARISDGKPFFFTGLWTQPSSGRTGITFANVDAPANSTSFLFNGPVFAFDVSLSFPRPAVSSKEDDESEFFGAGEGEPGEDDDSAPAVTSRAITPSTKIFQFARRFFRRGASAGQVGTADFIPTGNVIRIGAPRAAVRPDALPFNGIAIDPLAIAIAYLRGNTACGSNEIIVQTFDPVRGRKIGPPKFGKRCVKNFINYGISLFNPKFKNGSTD